ncbi:MAG TPA: MFS transporter [Candidatus Binatia bacterium]|nr:MFS transporter [Candidatus Binatia bacterium]
MTSARRSLWAWCWFDFANQPFTTLVVTFIYGTYFTQAIASDAVRGTVLWSRAITITGLTVAALAPVLGTLADRGGSRRRFLLYSVVLCVVPTAALTFVPPDHEHAILLALTLFIVANVTFELGYVFYNSFLPELAPAGAIGRISGYGWAFGYMGGLAALIVALVGFVQPATPWFGIPTEAGFNIRATNLLVAAWFAVFCVPFFAIVSEPPPAPGAATWRAVLRQLREDFREVRRYREVVRFLVARLLYNDGLVTVFAFGGIYAAGTFGMSFGEVLVFAIALNVAAGLGALAFGFVDDRIGGKLTVLLSLVALAAATLLAVWAPTRTWFWAAGLLIGIFAGPNQAASRSLMGRFVPPVRQGQFFGLFAFSGKLTTFAGPLLLGLVSEWTGSQRLGILTILFFFVAGALVLASVDEERGIAAAREAPAR